MATWMTVPYIGLLVFCCFIESYPARRLICFTKLTQTPTDVCSSTSQQPTNNTIQYKYNTIQYKNEYYYSGIHPIEFRGHKYAYPYSGINPVEFRGHYIFLIEFLLLQLKVPLFVNTFFTET